MRGETTCPHCGRVNNAHDGPDPGLAPEPGDVSLCWKCGGLGIFTGTGVRRLTAEEETEVADSPEVKRARAAIAESHTPPQASQLRWSAR